MLNDLYVKQVEEKYGRGAASRVVEALEKADTFLELDNPYVEATREVEEYLFDQDVPEKVIRLCLVAVHAQYQGWDDAFDFFLERQFDLATDGQAELIRWVDEENWLQ